MGSAVLMALMGAASGVGELYGLAAAQGAALATAAIWLHRQAGSVLSEATVVSPSRTAPGADVIARVVLTNSRRRPVAPLDVSVPIRHLRSWDPRLPGSTQASFGSSQRSLRLPALGPIASAQATLKVMAPYRGLWAIGPVTAALSDVLGLTEKKWTSRRETYFVVHPRVQRLPVPRRLATAISDGLAKRHVPSRRGTDFHAVREYQDGDDLRRLHWRSTARWDRLMVRQDDDERGCVVCIGLDLRAESQTPGSLERALEAAASIACMALAQPACALRLTTTSGVTFGPASGEQARGAVLDLLATASVLSGAPLTRLFGAQPEMAVLISSTREAAQELLAREGTWAPRSVVAVLTEEGNWTGQPYAAVTQLPPVLLPVTVVNAAGGLATAWAAALGSQSRARGAPSWPPPAALELASWPVRGQAQGGS